MFNRKTIFKFLFNFFAGSFATILGVFAFGKNFLDMPLRQSIGLGIIIYAGLFTIWILVWLFNSLYKSFKLYFLTSVWGEGILLRNQVFAELNSVGRSRYNEGLALRALVTVCDNTKEFFDTKTGSETSVSIKIPIFFNSEYETMEMRNLCRDSQHFSRDNDKYKSIKHTVIGNTAFYSIVADLRDQKFPLYYLNNNIENTRDYRNTSSACYKDGHLPYKSEIVVPILPLKRDGRDYQMCGFLCLDSDKAGVFGDARYDIPYLMGIADGLYDVVKRIVEPK